MLPGLEILRVFGYLHQPHLGKFGARLTTLSEEQAAYIGVTVEGPYKSHHYRY